jgi:hypothetical protein
MERFTEEVVVTFPGAPTCNFLDKRKKIVNMSEMVNSVNGI